jgi:antirestriction protein ArdC
LDDDHKYIFDAASAAQKAVDFVMNEMTSEHQLLTA